MFQLLWHGLQSVCNQQSIEDHVDMYPAQFQTMFKYQQTIGWEQLYYGQIASSWAYYIDHSSQNHTSSTIFYSQVIGIIWTYILDAWKLRNQALHSLNPNANFQWQALEPQVQQIFQIINKNPKFHGQEPCLSVEQIMLCPIHMISQFVQSSNHHICTRLQAAGQCTQLHTWDIRSYFKWTNNDTHADHSAL